MPIFPTREMGAAALRVAGAVVLFALAGCGETGDDGFDPRAPDVVEARRDATDRVRGAVEAVVGAQPAAGGQHDECKTGRDTYKARDPYRRRCDVEYRAVSGLDAAEPADALGEAEQLMSRGGCEGGTFDRDSEAVRALLEGNGDAAPFTTCEYDGQRVTVHVGRSDNTFLATTVDNRRSGDADLGKTELDGATALAEVRDQGHTFVVFARASARYHYEKR